MSSQNPTEPSYEIYAHTVREMRELLIDMKGKKEDINWKEKAEELQRELKALRKNKNYGLFWKEKWEIFDIQSQNALPVLEEISELAITQDDTPSNMIIEWDNYHALSILNYTHKGKIDVIYIDPPYNTGNKDFVYNDRYVDKEDDFRHSKWLSFMEKRLNLAKDLLKETGVIFISIDDNEYAQLKLIGDEIFGENNIETIIWHKVADDSGKLKITYRIRREHEYVLICYKNKDQVFFKKYLSDRNYKNEYTNPDNDPRGPYKQGIISTTEAKSKSTGKNFYTIETPSGKIIARQWRFSKEEFEILDKDNRIYYGKDGSSVPSSKVFINEQKETTPTSLFSDFGTAKTAGFELENIFNDRPFSYPKPVTLIQHIIRIASNKNSLILDFFAWSWTTGHAVLALNKEDGGNRRFILCSNRENTNEFPDKNICRDITYERVKRVATWYTSSKWEKIDGLGGNIRYLKTDFIQKEKWTDNIRHRMVGRCSEMLCLKENIWERIENISDDNMRFYKRWDKYLAILFSLFQFEDFCKILCTFDKPIAIYVFSRGQMTNGDFDWIQVPYSVEEIPDPILAVYKTIFWL